MKIGGLEKCSLVDFPSCVSAIVFTQGCNFHCGYCYNPELVYPTLFKESIPEEKILAFLESRKGKLGGVVITGGEPTMQEDLIPFINKVRSLGFKVKLDTNGASPEVLKEIIKNRIVDYIAMDIKGSLDKYADIACVAISPDKIKKSIRLILNSKIDYEFRTTVIKSQISLGDFKKIGKMIQGARLYALQNFVIPPEYKINNRKFLKEKTYSKEEFEQIKEIMEGFVKKCIVR